MEPKISIRVPEELYRKAKEKAEREDTTLSQVLRRCLREWVKDYAPEPEPKGEG
jgi:predicted HicB family RNase H-like nuclease